MGLSRSNGAQGLLKMKKRCLGKWMRITFLYTLYIWLYMIYIWKLRYKVAEIAKIKGDDGMTMQNR